MENLQAVREEGALLDRKVPCEAVVWYLVGQTAKGAGYA